MAVLLSGGGYHLMDLALAEASKLRDQVAKLEAEKVILHDQSVQATLFIHSLEADRRDMRIALEAAEKALADQDNHWHRSTDTPPAGHKSCTACEGLNLVRKVKL